LKFSGDRLEGELAARLLPVYVVSGDDPLLTAEAADAIRARAKRDGYSEREVFFVERGGSTWNDVLRAAEALSLFASRRIVEVRMPSGKPGTGEADLARVIAAAGDDLLLLILTERLDSKSEGADWLQLAEQHGARVTVWPIKLPQFPAWLRARLQAVGLKADDAAVALLVERTEGNLLAAKQEIDKLALLLERGATVNAAAVAASSSDSARFGLYQFTDIVIAGDPARSLRMLDGLRAEGTEAPLILWALLRARGSLQQQPANPRRPLSFPRLTQRAARADRMAKGRMRGDTWDELALLTAELCGKKILPMERWR
jgi:DNA polymerase III subunit delta